MRLCWVYRLAFVLPLRRGELSLLDVQRVIRAVGDIGRRAAKKPAMIWPQRPKRA